MIILFCEGGHQGSGGGSSALRSADVCGRQLATSGVLSSAGSTIETAVLTTTIHVQLKVSTYCT